MYLGRIITKSKNFESLDFIEKTSSREIDNSVPTLIIGRAVAEEIYGKDKVKILDKQIEPNVYWTFRKTERRVDYEEDVKSFYDRVKKFAFAKVEYSYFSIFVEDLERTKKFIKWLYEGGKKTIYISHNHIYIYFNGKVYGISLMDIEYIGKNKNDVIEKIKQNKNNAVVESKDFISPQFLQLIEDSNILVPYLYFLTK